MKRFLLLILFSLSAVAQTVTSTTVPVNTNMVTQGKGTTFFNVNLQYRKLANMAALRALPITLVPDGSGVDVLGYYTAGDGGGGTYVLTNSVSGTNAYGARVLAAGGAKSWNVSDESSCHVKMFGAKGDGVTDDTAAFQAWVDWVEGGELNGKPLNRSSAAIPSGQYILSTVYLESAVIRAESRSIDFQYYRSVSLLHKIGATNDMFIVDIPAGLGDRSAPVFEGLYIQGAREQNLKNPKAVTAATSRTNFFVAVGDLPPNPFTAGVPNFTQVGDLVTGTDWPYGGFCFFFTSENRYMGGACIESYNYATGEIVIKPGFDWYETISTAGGLLTTDAKVCFSTYSTEDTFVIPDATLMDGTTAGYSAINWRSIYGQLGSSLQIRNCTIQNFHTGVRFGSVIFPQVHDNTFRYHTYAPIAAWSGGYLRDTDMRNYFAYQGYRQNWPNLTPETIVLTTGGNNSFRNGMFGMYGYDSSGMTSGTMLINYSTIGIFARGCLETQIEQILLDGITMHGMIVLGGSAGNVFMSIGSLITRECQGTLPPFIGSERRGIWSLGPSVALNINRMSFSQFSGGPATNRFDYGFRNGTSDIFAIGSLIRTNGFATLTDPGSSTAPLIGSFLGLPGGITSGGGNAAKWGRTDLDGQVTLSFGSGRPQFFSTFGQLVFTDNVTPNTSRNIRLGGLHYAAGEEPVTAINMQLGGTNNIVNIGGGTGVQNAATQVGIFLSSTNNTLSGTEVARFETNRFWVYGGDISLNNLGSSIRIKTGDNGKFTTATLVSGSVTVTNTSWLVTTAVFPVHLTHSGTPGALNMSAVASSGTVRTFTSTSGTDNGTIALIGIDQQP